ncbi:MAG: phosphoribosylanthranilate isomerase [Puniceicoccales bacterium]|jgi:phosphoribosylanthranilate isomerase|nr:phosphoribosylanthranilate isomerase [Puniceicoccales bacterium]
MAPFTVKVCGITRSADATDALAQGVAYIGVNRWPRSPRFVADASVRALIGAVPAGRRVFVDVHPAPEKITAAVDDGFDFFQIHFDPAHATARADVAAWEERAGRHRLWLAPRVPDGTDWPQWVFAHAGTFLCDGFRAGQFGGTGHTADWGRFTALKNAHPEKRWLLAGGLGPATIALAAGTGADFFDLNSAIEDAPGLKNVEKLAQTLTVLRKIAHPTAPNAPIESF